MVKSTIVAIEKENRKKRAGTEHTTAQRTGIKITKKDASLIGLIQELFSCLSKKQKLIINY